MRVWRIAREKRCLDLSGEGARLYGGRWNSIGVPMVYTASSISLAALEVFVHVDSDILPSDLALVAIDIPDITPYEDIDPALLPHDWATVPPPLKLRDLGDKWFHESPCAVMRVPSAITPEEFNYLLNPTHPNSVTFKATRIRSFQFDGRMTKTK